MEILAASIGAVLTALAGYFLGVRQANRQRQREQQWRIYLNLRSLEELHNPKAARIPEDKHLKLIAEHRERILQDLVGSELPEMKEILRAVNWVGFPDAKSKEDELKRIGLIILKRLDWRYGKAIAEIEREWGGLKEGEIGPESGGKNDQ
jgi:hypothetical protein